MGLGIGFNLGPFRASGSFRGGDGDGDGGNALLYLIAAGFVLMAASYILEFILFAVIFIPIYFAIQLMTVFMIRLSVPESFRKKQDAVFGFFLISLAADCGALVIGIVIALFAPPWLDDWFSNLGYLELVAGYLGLRLAGVGASAVWHFRRRRFEKKALQIAQEAEKRALQIAQEADEEFRRVNFLVSNISCSLCGGEVQRSKQDFEINCTSCGFRHSHKSFPDLVDEPFRLELERLHDLRQRQELIRAAVVAERELEEKTIQAWRRRARSAMHDVDLEVRKVLNPSPGDTADLNALRRVFDVANKSIEVSEVRLGQIQLIAKESATFRRILQQLEEQIPISIKQIDNGPGFAAVEVNQLPDQ